MAQEPVNDTAAGTAPATGVVPALLQELSVELSRFSSIFAQRHGLHSTDVEALGHLHLASLRGEPMTPSSLAASIDLSPPATTALLRRLEGNGHIERTPDPADGRRQLLGLHDSARAIASNFFGPLAFAIEGSLEGFTDAEVAVVVRWLRSAIDTTRSVAEDAASRSAGA